MQPNVKIKKQNRKSFAMRVLPSGELEVSIPVWLSEKHPSVQKFIRTGLKKLAPHIPKQKPQSLHNEQIVRDLVADWARLIGVKPRRVQLRSMTRKWGSCSSKGTITLNTALYYIPLHLVEYVVVHELVHMHVFDHSPAFWEMLEHYLPACMDYERELNTYRV